MKTSLGKGLQSLIPKKESRIESLIKRQSAAVGLAKSKKESIFNIEIDKIRPNPDQPRRDLSDGLEELSESIKEHGILQPLIVTKIEKSTERGQDVEYELIAGERRWRASRMAHLPHVPVIIRNSSANEKLEIALVENIQREDLNPMETALAFRHLQKDFGLTHKKIAKKVGKSRTAVTNIIRLLSLSGKIQKAMMAKKISEGHGRALLMAKPSAQDALFRAIIKNNLSVRHTEERARKLTLENKPYSHGPKNPFFKKIEKDLGEILGRRVSILKRGDTNYINIEFADQKELEKFTAYLMKI